MKSDNSNVQYDRDAVKEYKVYLATNTVNGKQYVGASRYPIEHRWRGHVANARDGSDFPLHRAIREFGQLSFKITLLESGLTRSEAEESEKRHIVELGTKEELGGYNRMAGGWGGSGHGGTHRERARRTLKTRMEKKSKAYFAGDGKWVNSKTVEQLTMDGALVATFKSTRQAAKALNTSQGNISTAARGKYRHAAGFKWRYVEAA